MGQKVNPNIFQINKTNEWDSKYIEKKSKDFYLHTIKDLEVKKFIYKFFKNYNLSVHNCKLNYSDSSLNIYVSYLQDYNSISFITNISKTQEIEFKCNADEFEFNYNRVRNNRRRKHKVKNDKVKNNRSNNRNIVRRTTKNYHNYENLIFKKFVLKKKLNKSKISTVRRAKWVKCFKKYFNIKKARQIKNILLNNFLNNFFKSLSLFYKKLIKINLIIQPLNTKIERILTKKKQEIIQKKLIKLKKYEKGDFFREGINTIFYSIKKDNSAFLLSNFVSLFLKKLKFHNFFLKFIKATLNTFTSSESNRTRIKGIKLKIKGRLNKAPRARVRIIKLGDLPVFSENSTTDYAETTAYSANGTLGVKVWICYKNNNNKNVKRT